MNKLFNPKSIAIIGASRHADKLGYQILDNLIKGGYAGKIYPINPKATKIINLKTYSNVCEINDEIDLALIVIPAEFVLLALKDCQKKEIKYAVIISAGFSEIGEKGKKIQQQIKEEITNIRIVGPNCLGIINTSNKLNLTFASPKLIKGKVSAIFQSGALGVAIFDLANKYDFGFAKFLSLGNKVDIEESEIINFLEDDQETKIIALYLENISKPGVFFQVIRKVSKIKPIVILKGGVTKEGAKAALSHTAALISEEKIFQAMSTQGNLLVVDSMEEMLSVISILSCEPPVNKANLGIITNAGGIGILCTDSASNEGFRLPKINGEYKNNPIDLTGTALAEDYEKAINYMVKDSNISSILVLLTPQTTTEIEKTALVLAKYKNASKPIIASFLGDKTVAKAIEILRKNNISHFEDPEQGIRALAKIIKYNQNLKNEIININNESEVSFDSKKINDIFPSPKNGIASTKDEAIKIFKQINSSVAVKAITRPEVHKYKSKKILLNISHEKQLVEAINQLKLPVLIQQMIDYPFEVIIGAKRDKELGIIITFGQGGIFTEKYNDVSSKIFPLTNNDMDEMIKETNIGNVLIKEKVDLLNLKKIIEKVAFVMKENKDISEIDLNPIKVSQNKLSCVDIRIIKEKNEK